MHTIISIFITLGIIINVLYSIDGNLLGTTTERWGFVTLVYFMLYGFTAGMFLPVGKSPKWWLTIPLLVIFLLYYFTLFYYKSFSLNQKWEGALLWLLYPIIGIASAALLHNRDASKITSGVIKYLVGSGIAFFLSLCMRGIDTFNKISYILLFLLSSVIFFVCYGMSAKMGKKELSFDTEISKWKKIIFGLFILIHIYFIIVAYCTLYYPNSHYILVAALSVTGYIFLIKNKQLGYHLVIVSVFVTTIVLSWMLMLQWIIPFIPTDLGTVSLVLDRSFVIYLLLFCIIQLITIGINRDLELTGSGNYRITRQECLEEGKRKRKDLRTSR